MALLYIDEHQTRGVYEHQAHGPSGSRHELFGFNNYTAVFGTLIQIAQLATSNDWSSRRMGAPQWKQIQRWNYACFAFAAAHVIRYQRMGEQKIAFEVAAVCCIVSAIIVEAAASCCGSAN